MKIVKLIAICLATIVLSACSGGGSGNNSSSLSTAIFSNVSGDSGLILNDKDASTPLTISNSGVISQLEYEDQTRSYITIHNNSNKLLLSDIHYNVSYDKNKTKFSLEASSLNNCKKIQAELSCPLYFNNTLNANTDYAEVNLEATYVVGKNTNHFTRKLKFSRGLKNNQLDVEFSSNLLINGYGNNIGHGVMYVHGDGKLTINKPGIRISENPAISGLRVIEISAPIINASYKASILNSADTKLRANSGDFYVSGGKDKIIDDTTHSNFKDNSENTALISISEPYAHDLDIYGDGKDSRTRTITLNNNGNIAAKLEYSKLEDSKGYLQQILEGSTCKDILPALGSCIIKFKLDKITTKSVIRNKAIYNLRYTAVSRPGEPQQIRYELNYKIHPGNFNFGLISEDPIGDVLVRSHITGQYLHPTGTVGDEYIILGDRSGSYRANDPKNVQRFKLVYKNFAKKVKIINISTDVPLGFRLLTRPEDPTSCIKNPQEAKDVEVDENSTCTYIYEAEISKLERNRGTEFLNKTGSHKFNLKVATFELKNETGDEISVTPERFHGNTFDDSHLSLIAKYDVEKLHFEPKYNDTSNFARGYMVVINSTGSLFSPKYEGVNFKIMVPKIATKQTQELLGRGCTIKLDNSNSDSNYSTFICTVMAGYSSMYMMLLTSPKTFALIGIPMLAISYFYPPQFEPKYIAVDNLVNNIMIGKKSDGRAVAIEPDLQGGTLYAYNVLLDKNQDPYIDDDMPVLKLKTVPEPRKELSHIIRFTTDKSHAILFPAYDKYSENNGNIYLCKSDFTLDSCKTYKIREGVSIISISMPYFKDNTDTFYILMDYYTPDRRGLWTRNLWKMSIINNEPRFEIIDGFNPHLGKKFLTSVAYPSLFFGKEDLDSISYLNSDMGGEFYNFNLKTNKVQSKKLPIAMSFGTGIQQRILTNGMLRTFLTPWLRKPTEPSIKVIDGGFEPQNTSFSDYDNCSNYLYPDGFDKGYWLLRDYRGGKLLISHVNLDGKETALKTELDIMRLNPIMFETLTKKTEGEYFPTLRKDELFKDISNGRCKETQFCHAVLSSNHQGLEIRKIDNALFYSDGYIPDEKNKRVTALHQRSLTDNLNRQCIGQVSKCNVNLKDYFDELHMESFCAPDNYNDINSCMAVDWKPFNKLSLSLECKNAQTGATFKKDIKFEVNVLHTYEIKCD